MSADKKPKGKKGPQLLTEKAWLKRVSQSLKQARKTNKKPKKPKNQKPKKAKKEVLSDSE